MKTKNLLLVLTSMILAAVLLCGAGAHAAGADEKKPDLRAEVASLVYDGKKIPVTINDVLYERMLNPRLAMAQTSGTQRLEMAREITRLAAYRSLLYQEGIKRGIDRSTTVSAPLEQRMNDYLQRRLKASVMTEAPTPKPEAIEQYYLAHKSEFMEKEGFQFQYIFSYCENLGDTAQVEKARQRIEEAKTELAQGKDFAEVARRHSNSPSGNIGQVVGFEPGKINPAIEEAVRKLADGAMSEVLQLNNGFALVRRVRHQVAGQKPLESVRDEIRAKLAGPLAEAHWDKFYQERLKVLNPSVNRQLLLKEVIQNESPVFRYSDQVMTYGQLRPRLEASGTGQGPLKVEDRNKQLEMIFQELLLATIARQRGLDQDREAIEMRRQVLRELIYNYEIVRMSKALQAKVQVTPAEIERYYRENQKYFSSERETRLEVIRIQAPGMKDKTGRLDMQQKAELFQRAEVVRRKLAAGEDFAALMKQTNGEWDGKWDFQPYGPRGHEVDLAVEKLKVGEISTPVEYKQGFYIIKLSEAKEPKQLPLAEVREKIILILRGTEARKQIEALRDKRMKECQLKIDQKALAQVVALF